jgi:hypothetical protein
VQGEHIAYTHNCNIPGAMRGARAGIFLRGHASRPRRGCPHIPGPCVTPAQECNAHTGDALMRAGDGTGGNRRPLRRGSHFGGLKLPGATTPAPATVTTPGAATPAPAKVRRRGQLRPRRQRSSGPSMRCKMRGQCKKCGSRQHSGHARRDSEHPPCRGSNPQFDHPANPSPRSQAHSVNPRAS